MSNRLYYTAEQLEFLKVKFKEFSASDLTKAFNKQFDTLATMVQIKSTLTRNKFTCDRKRGVKRGDRLSMTSDQVEFISAEYKNLTLNALTVALNQRFGINKTVKQLKNFVRNHAIKSGRTGCFDKGHTSWNEGTKGLMKKNKTSFKKGDVPGNIKPIGHERICKKDGYIIIKTSANNPHTGYKGFYRAKHIVNWEAQNGPVPDGMILRFIDGDKTNCEPDNLEVINKSLHLRLNQNDFTNTPNELKQTVRSISELEVNTFKKLKEMQDNE